MLYFGCKAVAKYIACCIFVITLCLIGLWDSKNLPTWTTATTYTWFCPLRGLLRCWTDVSPFCYHLRNAIEMFGTYNAVPWSASCFLCKNCTKLTRLKTIISYISIWPQDNITLNYYLPFVQWSQTLKCCRLLDFYPFIF